MTNEFGCGHNNIVSRGKISISISSALFLVLFLVLPASVSAHHKEAVLGEATASSELVFPPVTSGSGFILPDSPLFFLDQFSQTVKLLFAFSSEQRAKVRAQIAGERLAELRIMLERQNSQGINVALSQLTKEVGFAAKDLSDAAAKGTDVKLLAKQINEDIKFQRKLLNLVAEQASGSLKRQLKAARQALKEAKVEVEDELPKDELENEIEEGLLDEVDNEVDEASDSVTKVEKDLIKIQAEAEKSSKKALERREEALEKAIEKRKEGLGKVEVTLLTAEKRKQESLLKAQKRTSEQAKEAVGKAREATVKFKEASQIVAGIKNTSVGGESNTSGNSTSGSGKSDND